MYVLEGNDSFDIRASVTVSQDDGHSQNIDSVALAVIILHTSQT